MKVIAYFGLYCFLACLLWSCGVYSFSGSNLAPGTKTLSIQTFADRSGAGPAILGQTFTNKAQQYFQSNSTLVLVPKSGDLQIEGNVIAYTLSPIAPVGNDLAAKTRLTITVQIKFTNLKDGEQDFDQQFSSYFDFDQRQVLSPSLETTLIETISNQILLDIYQKTVANW
jgi:Lipopolysaccharide-assembly